VALARVRGEGRAVDRRGRAGGAAELGDGEPRQDVRQVLVHVAGGPRRRAAARRAGADGVAAGRGAGASARRPGARPRREVRGGQLGGGAQGGQGGDGGAGVDQPQRRLLAAARQGLRGGRRPGRDEAPRALPVSHRRRRRGGVRCDACLLRSMWQHERKQSAETSTISLKLHNAIP
jgi:hypothetical protein